MKATNTMIACTVLKQKSNNIISTYSAMKNKKIAIIINNKFKNGK